MFYSPLAIVSFLLLHTTTSATQYTFTTDYFCLGQHLVRTAVPGCHKSRFSALFPAAFNFFSMAHPHLKNNENKIRGHRHLIFFFFFFGCHPKTLSVWIGQTIVFTCFALSLIGWCNIWFTSVFLFSLSRKRSKMFLGTTCSLFCTEFWWYIGYFCVVVLFIRLVSSVSSLKDAGWPIIVVHAKIGQ